MIVETFGSVSVGFVQVVKSKKQKVKNVSLYAHTLQTTQSAARKSRTLIFVLGLLQLAAGATVESSARGSHIIISDKK